MLKRYFIPLIAALVVVVMAIYFLAGRTVYEHDIRAAVPVEKFTLGNGLRVVVMPNDRIPVVTHLLVVKAGAADDPYGKSGLAHYLEHLMFTGTKDFPEGTYDHAIARVGGMQNASTGRDYTLYYATVPKQHLSMVMAMEADRLANLTFSPSLAARELKVISEERNMRVDNDPASQWMEQLDALTFLNHPYHQPVIGWAEDMATFTPADAQGFFSTYYRPSNMVLVVAGDVTAHEARRYALRYYGGLSAGDASTRHWPKEPQMRLARRGDMEDERVGEPRLMKQYVAPSVMEGKTTQALPLSVFAQYLGGGDSSILYDALVRQQKLATRVSVSYDPQAVGPALFRIVAVPAAGVGLPQLEEALNRTLTQVLSSPLDAASVARAKTLLTSEIIYAQDGLQSLAHTMADLFAIGLDEQYFYQWSENIAAVTDATMLEAARAVIKPKQGVTGYLTPSAAGPAPAAEVKHE